MSQTSMAPGRPPRPKKKVMLYARYERFWHWSQALLIFTLLFTGLGLHGVHGLVPFKLAVMVHTVAALTLIGLWVLTIFWHFTTGQWRQYLPTPKGLFAIVRFYAYGILVGEPHPYKKTLRRKQNNLQNLAYLMFVLILGPALWASGIAYLLYNLWSGFGWSQAGFQLVVFVHTAAAYAMAIFIVAHVYLATTGKTPTHYIRTMITGYDKIELTEAEEAYLKETGQKLEDA